MYQEVDYGALAVSLLAGRRDFFDYAEAYQRHFIDLDICHYHPDSTFVGASYGIAPYHTGSRPYALNAPVSGLFLLWSLTGDQDAFDAAAGIADWLVKEAVGVGAGSGRAAGWPLRSAVIAWEHTGRDRYLDFAAGPRRHGPEAAPSPPRPLQRAPRHLALPRRHPGDERHPGRGPDALLAGQRRRGGGPGRVAARPQHGIQLDVAP